MHVWRPVITDCKLYSHSELLGPEHWELETIYRNLKHQILLENPQYPNIQKSKRPKIKRSRHPISQSPQLQRSKSPTSQAVQTMIPHQQVHKSKVGDRTHLKEEVEVTVVTQRRA